MDSYKTVYRKAKGLLEDPDLLWEQLDRVLGATERDYGERLEQTVRLAEMALVAKLDPWWTGPPQPNLRQAVSRLDRNLHDPLALGLALRLAAGYARLGRVDDEAHRLGTLCARLLQTELKHPEDLYAREVARHLEEALFLPSSHYAYELVKDLSAEEVCKLASSQIPLGNPSFAALLAEMRLVRELDSWHIGPPLAKVEAALETYRKKPPEKLQELGILLARAYVKGGFVDLRARDHVVAILEGDEAKLLGPEEAIGFQEYVQRDCFDYPYEHLYARVRELSPHELRSTARKHTRDGAITAAQGLCEMALVRRHDDWYLGDPARNVRNAISRYLESNSEENPDTDWFAHYLAGLYASTLEGAKHARLLVHAVVSRSPNSQVFAEATLAAGIPKDVTPEELHRLYKDVVEIDAKVKAFQALVEETEHELSDYEKEAYAEVLRFLERGDRSVLSEVTQTLGSLAEVVVPSALIRSVTSMVEDVLRLAASGASVSLRRERILGELVRRDPALRSLEKIRQGNLELLDEVAWSITLENRLAAALEGLGCGLGGATLVLVDLPMLILVNLNAVVAIATCYGFDVDEISERDFALSLLAGGSEALRHLVGANAAPENLLSEIGQDHFAANRAALALHTTASRIASRLTKQKLMQVLPILGGAVGAGLNFHFTYSTSRAAVMAYRYRWLIRRFLPDEDKA